LSIPIELSHDQGDHVVKESLKDAYRLLDPKDLELRYAFQLVFQHYAGYNEKLD